MRGGQGARGAELGHGWRFGESPGVSVADALSWAVSHAEGRVTQSIRSAFTAAICEFATHRIGIIRCRMPTARCQARRRVVHSPSR